MSPTPFKEVSVNSPVLSAVGSGRRVRLQDGKLRHEPLIGRTVNALHEAHLLLFWSAKVAVRFIILTLGLC